MRIGDRIAERFELLKEAGSGGMGVVYQARDHATDQLVALKVLIERREELSDRFTQEVELLSGLEHPHIVGYVTHGRTPEGAAYLVMPWLEGRDLQQRVAAGPLSVDEAMVLVRRVAEALSYLHGRGIVHRDIKPSNLFLPHDAIAQVQLIDLGIARATVPLRPMTLSGALLGTPGFMAPEQARGDGHAAPTVDIFALGCVLFECLTGQRLFSGSHVMAVLAKVLVDEAPRVRDLRPDVPDALDLLVHRLVAKDPDRRARDGAQLVQWVEDLERTLPDSPPGPARPSLTASERRVVTVAAIVLPASASPPDEDADATQPEAGSFFASSGRFGARVFPLDDRTAVALAEEGLGAADQALVLARFARHLAEAFREAAIALATGSALSGSRVPIGEAIDRAVLMVRGAERRPGLRIDEATAALVASRFDVRDEGGRLHLGDERVSDPTRPLLGRPTSCVGRDRELAMLEATYAECLEGEGPKVVVVMGAAGAGKSRLRHELERRLRSSARPPRVVQCRGNPLNMATPYAQIAQLLRSAAEIPERAATDAIREKLAAHVEDHVAPEHASRVTDFLGEIMGASLDVAGDLPVRAARRSAEAMADQVRMAFVAILRGWCRQQPTVLVVEDMHWCDAASMKLLEGTVRKLPGEGLFVLALARPETHDRFPDLWRKSYGTEIHLPPLSPRAAETLVREVVGDAASAEDVKRIVERSDGNAFYLEELIRSAAHRTWRPTSVPPPSAHADLPDTIIAVAQARLSRLEPSERRVLRAASIYGASFSIDGLAALVDDEPAALARFVTSLVDHEVFMPAEDGNRKDFVFRHVLLCAAAYATLTDEDRALGHRLAAQWLEQNGEDREVAALHWLEAGDRRRAAGVFTQAGEARLGRAHAEPAARCAVRALLLGDPETEGLDELARRIRLLADALDAARFIDAMEVITGIDVHAESWTDIAAEGGRRLVTAALERSLGAIGALADRVVVADLFSQAACAVAALSGFKEAKAFLARARALGGIDEPVPPCVLHATAKVARRAGEYGDAVAALSETVLPTDRRARIDILLVLATSLVAVQGHDALDAGLDCVSRAEGLLEDVEDDPVARAHCAKARMVCFNFAGQHAQMAKTAEEAADYARRAGLRYEEGAHLHNLADALVRLGEFDRAREALVQCGELAQDMEVESIHLLNAALLAYMDRQPGRIEAVASHFQAANNGLCELHARYWLGRLLAAEKSPRAADELGRALVLARKLGIRAFADECTQAVAELQS
jgi:eukaryotic-like serine/threonine-protein kinase